MTGRRRALIIAVDDYAEVSLRPFAVPVDDAQALADALAARDYDVEVVANQPSYAVRHRIDGFLSAARPDDLAVVHICGVGITDRDDLFLAGSDTRPAYVRSSGLEAAFVRRSLLRCRAHLAVLVLDCHWGTVAGRAAPAGTIDVAAHFAQDDLRGNQARVVITASSAVEIVVDGGTLQGSPPEQPSVFTRALTEALASSDDPASLDELYDDVRARLAAHVPDRTPDRWYYGPAAPAVIAGSPPPATVAAPPPPGMTRQGPPAGAGVPSPRPGSAAPPQLGHPRPRGQASRRPAGAVRPGLRAFGWWLAAVALGLGLVAFLLISVTGTSQPVVPPADTEAATDGAPLTDAESVVSVALCAPGTLIPAQSSDACSAQVLAGLFSPLVEYDAETERPLWGDDARHAMAADVASDDQQTWTIALKEGWTFHDGTPVTAQAFVDAWNHNAYAPNAMIWSFVFAEIDGYDDLQCEIDELGACEERPPDEQMQGLTAVDDRTISVTLSRPFSQFPLMLHALAFSPLPEAFYSNRTAYENAPVGTGPFRIDEPWVAGDDITLTRNGDYREGPAAIGGVRFVMMPDPDAAYVAFAAGEIDAVASVPAWRMGEAQREHLDTYVEGSNTVYEYLGVPVYDDRFADPRVRQAISMAIDRDAIADAVLQHSSAADAFRPPGIPGYREGACGTACAYDPDAARQLLDDAGGFDGTLTLWFNSEGGNEEWMEVLADQLRDGLGVDVELQSEPFSDYLQRLTEHRITGPYRLGWLMDYPSPQNYLHPLLYTDASSNYTGWSQPQFDRLVDEGDAAASIADSLEWYAQAEAVAAEEMPVIPLFFHRNALVHAERLHGVRLDESGFVNWADVMVSDDLAARE